MQFGISATFGATLEHVSHLDHINFDFLEVGVKSFLVPEQPQDAFENLLQLAKQLPVPIEVANGLLPPDLVLIESATQRVDRARVERYIKTTLQRAEKAGIRIIVFGSGQARACPPGHDYQDAKQQLQAHLIQWGEWASNYGIEICLEPLRTAETNILNTVVESGAFVLQCNMTLLVDTYHMACNGEDPATILPHSNLLAHVHVAEKQERAATGTHGEDLRPYLSALHRANYQKRLSIECIWRNAPLEIEPALTCLREQWDSVQAEV